MAEKIDIESSKNEDRNKLLVLVWANRMKQWNVTAFLIVLCFSIACNTNAQEPAPPPPPVIEDLSTLPLDAWLEGRPLLSQMDTLLCDSAKKVVVDIWVAPDGQVVRSTIYRPGSIYRSQRCAEIAAEHARTLSFQPSNTAEAEQKGRVLYRFTSH